MDEFNTKLTFPEKFMFGTAVAAFQVEGNQNKVRKTDWDVFFEKNQDQIVRPGEVGPNWWGSFELIEKDLLSVSELGARMQRISVEWERIEPQHGEINKEALKKYREIVNLCLRNNLTPMVTINHFTLPDWVMKKGGWENPQIVQWLSHFAEILLEEFGDIEYWVIVNEPSMVTYMGNLLGIFPPNKKSLISTIRTRQNIVKAQQHIYPIIKKRLPNSYVGNAFNFLWLRSADLSSLPERWLVKGLNYLINTNFVSATKDYMDFLGINYYTGYYIDLKLNYFSPTMRNEAIYVPHHLPFAKTVRPKTYKTDMGWPIVPDFFLDVLKHTYEKYKKPIIITENGLADRDDVYRSFYTLTHLVALWKAIDEGVDIRAYIHWSSLDNLEWAEGYSKRFGLIEVDPFTGKRQLRKGAAILSEIMKEKAIHVEKLIAQHIPEEQKEYALLTVKQLMESKKNHCPRISKSS